MKGRKFISLLMVLVLALVSVFALVGCSQHPVDDSFQGAISEQSYETKDSAVRAFLDNEISGIATYANFISYDKEDELSQKEIDALNLDDLCDVSEIVSVERGTVTFSDNNSYASSDDVMTMSANTAALGKSKDNDGGNKTTSLVLITFRNSYKYFVESFKKGQLITKSYISEILDYKKYVNMTETSVSESSAGLLGFMAKTKITTVTKITENAIYSKITTKAPTGNSVIESYIIRSGYSYYAYQRTGDDDDSMSSWQTMRFTYSSIEDFVESIFNFDHTYFERIDSGFTMADDKFKSYVEDVLSASGSINGEVTSGKVDYHVEDGRLSSSEAELKITVTTEGVSVNATSKATTEWTDYGTTVIDIPSELRAKVGM